ncbi:MAG: hypothetical protein ACYCSW_04815 [bacterium]
MVASLSVYSLVIRNSMRFYLRNFPAFAGMTPTSVLLKSIKVISAQV